MTDIANALGVSPAVLHTALINLALLATYLACLATSRLIPDTATGWRGVVRRLAGIISVDISNRIAPGITIAAVAKAAATTPPIPAKIAADEPPVMPTQPVQGE